LIEFSLNEFSLNEFSFPDCAANEGNEFTVGGFIPVFGAI